MIEEAEPDICAQIIEVERELRVRKRVYPKQIQAGHLDPDRAAQRVAALRAVLRTLRWVQGR